MPANRSNLSTPRKEKSGDGFSLAVSNPTAAVATKKKKRSACVRHKKHCRQYLVSMSDV